MNKLLLGGVFVLASMSSVSAVSQETWPVQYKISFHEALKAGLDRDIARLQTAVFAVNQKALNVGIDVGTVSDYSKFYEISGKIIDSIRYSDLAQLAELLDLGTPSEEEQEAFKNGMAQIKDSTIILIRLYIAHVLVPGLKMVEEAVDAVIARGILE